MKSAHSGFTLIEVMITLAIAALVLSALASLQVSLTRSTTKAASRLAHIERMVYFWRELEAELTARKKRVKRTFEEPAMQCTYEQLPVAKNSSLKKLKDLVIERITGEWSAESKKRQEVFVSFRFIPQEASDETRNHTH